MSISDTDIYMAEVKAWDPVALAEVTLRFSGQGPSGYTTGASDTPASINYGPRLQQVAMLSRTAFDDRRTSGRSRSAVGDIILRNDDYALDTYKRHSFDGRQIIVRRGASGAAYPAAFEVVLDATMATAVWDVTTVALKMRDWQKATDVPLQTNVFAGNNVLPAGLEGTDDLKGKPKPVAVGDVSGNRGNISPPRVNTSKLIYQVHDGAISDVTAVRERGSPVNRGFAFAARTTPYGGGAHVWYDAAYGSSSTWVMVGVEATTSKVIGAYSTNDGATWSNITFPAGLAATGVSGQPLVFFGNGKWVIGSLSDGSIWWSSNATTWTQATTVPVSAGACGVYATHLGLYVISAISGPNSGFMTSPDAVTWSAFISAGTTNPIRKIAYNGYNMLVAIYAFGGIISSPDATNWIVRSSAFNNTDFNALTYDTLNAQFIAYALGILGVGAQTGALSYDGVTWERRPPYLGNPLSQSSNDTINWLAHGIGVTLSLNVGGWLSSTTTGRSWTTRQQVSTGKTFLRVVFGNTSFMLLGQVNSGGAGFIYQSAATTYANTTDLLDDTKAPPAGTYIVCPSAGYFRLGSPPAGLITADVLEGATAADRTAAQVFVRGGLQRAGFVSGDWSASAITALDAADDSPVGIWVGPDEPNALCSDVADAAARTVGAWWAGNRAGVVLIKRLEDPAGVTPVLTLDQNDLWSNLRPLPSADPNGGIAPFKTTIRYAKNFTVQTSDVAGIVSAADQNRLRLQWLETSVENSAVLAAHPLSQASTIDTLYRDSADAAAEATRRQALLGADREWYECGVKMTTATLALELGDVIELAHSRYGIGGGTRFRIMGLAPDVKGLPKEHFIMLTLWK